MRSFEASRSAATGSLIDIDSDVTEVEDLDPNGDRVEAHVDPVSGEVLSETPED